MFAPVDTQTRSTIHFKHVSAVLDRFDISTMNKLEISLVAANRKPASVLTFNQTQKCFSLISEINNAGMYTNMSNNGKFFDVSFANSEYKSQRAMDIWRSGNRYQIGILLGYPENTVSRFIDPNKSMSYSKMLNILGNSLVCDIPVPIYVSYAIHVPAEISKAPYGIRTDEQTRSICLSYMEFMRKESSAIANQLEHEFGMELYERALAKKSKVELIKEGLNYRLLSRNKE